MKSKRMLGPLITLLGLATLLGCGPKPEEPVQLLYDRMQESLEDLDVASLKNRRIVIDPGHGGVFRGARGVAGLDEADANLGVALYLWGLLEEAGAEVVLTRKTDRDFVDGDSLKLREDLAARTEIVNQVRPDLFMSLHHNADVGRDTTFNEIQIYYRMGDDGPSLDIARVVARHLRGNLGETKVRVLPGNYFVLRNSQVPSILCEPSYITNTQVESKLKLSNKQRLEAEIYFLSLVDYFSRGVPRIAAIKPSGIVRTGLPEIEVVFGDGTVIDRSSVTVMLDGTPLLPFEAEFGRFVAFPTAPLASGIHTIVAGGKAIGGNACPKRSRVFEVALEPKLLNVTADFSGPARPYPLEIRATALDVNGGPVADSTLVSFRWNSGTVERATTEGAASVYVGVDTPFGIKNLEVRCRGLKRTVDLTGAPENDYISGFILTAEGDPVANAAILALPEMCVCRSDRNGYFIASPSGTCSSLQVTKEGFRRASLEMPSADYPRVTLRRLYSGLDPSVVITLDAAGGGEETGWVGPTGTTAADHNLELVRWIAGLLRSVGVTVHLTREADIEVGNEKRVMICESYESDLVLSVSHQLGPDDGVSVGHYPGSRGGTELSRHIGREMYEILRMEATTYETAEYLIQQTELLKRILENSPMAKVMTDLNGRITYANSGAERVFGIDAAEMRSMSMNSRSWKYTDASGKTLRRELRPFNRVKNDSKPVIDQDLGLKIGDSEIRWLRVFGNPILDHKGQFNGAVFSILENDHSSGV